MNESKKRPEKYGCQNQPDSQFSRPEDMTSSSDVRPGVSTLLDELNNCLLKLERQKDQLRETNFELDLSYRRFCELYALVPNKTTHPKPDAAASEIPPDKDGHFEKISLLRYREAPWRKTENGESSGLCSAQEKLRHFSHKTLEILENERKRIAMEIHDGLGGSLAAIKFLLEDILSRNGDNAEIAEPLHQTVQYIKDTIKKTKSISAGLRPIMLDDLGLKSTIRWCCSKLKKSFPEITLILEINIDESMIDDSQKILIYRIIQEAMTNAAKHGGADTIWLSLNQSNERLELEITDNGCGFDTGRVLSDKYRDGNGYGLCGIKAKTEICGGAFCINSLENKGTALRITLPLTGC